jgi:amino acid adenylation domain-containing protein
VAYVPLDPAYPRQRLALMLDDAQVPVLVTRRSLRGVLPETTASVVCLDEDAAALAAQSEANPASGVTPDHLAYVMYTSGSTGKPKGVMIAHRNVVGFLHAYRPVLREGPRRVGTNAISYAFDTSVDEIFSPLCFGGTVHVLREEDRADPERLAHYLVDHGITTAYIVPDLLAEVAAHLAPQADRLALTCLITGLAPKRDSLLQRFRDLSPTLRILNAYGPTEVTYAATAFEFRSAAVPDRETPIGVPFPNYKAYIVDPHLQPVPIGVAGEILIGGVGVSPGYLHRADLTAEQFIPDPFGGPPGATVYRTGVLGRYLPDGNIEFLGRLDHQVKIRGFRVELGEVEAALAAHPTVRQAVVVARHDEPGHPRLVAYVLPGPGARPDAGELRQHLRERLPEHMVPAAFVAMESFPFTPTGKIDRPALPAPDVVMEDGGRVSVAPQSPIEQRLAEIWAEVLHLRTVGVNDRFFDLGGDSLKVAQVLSRVRRTFGVVVSYRAFFDKPTVADLAAMVDASVTTTPGPRS